MVSKDRETDEEGETIIWNRESRIIVWRSNGGGASHVIGTAEAESIIRSSGEETPLLWPTTFPEYTADLYCERYTVYSDVTGARTLLGNLPSATPDWRYDDIRKVIIAGLASGDVAVCRLRVESL